MASGLIHVARHTRLNSAQARRHSEAVRFFQGFAFRYALSAFIVFSNFINSSVFMNVFFDLFDISNFLTSGLPALSAAGVFNEIGRSGKSDKRHRRRPLQAPADEEGRKAASLQNSPVCAWRPSPSRWEVRGWLSAPIRV
jgi:hypothetical protein